MSEPTSADRQPADGDMPSEIARLLDEIRGDTRWREEVAAARAAAAPPPPPTPVVDELAAPSAPATGTSVDEALRAMRAAVDLADEPIAIGARTPLLGDAMAAFRRRLHDEIRISQDRQTAANRATIVALEGLVGLIDPTNGESPFRLLFGAVGELTAALNDLKRRVAALEARVEAQGAQLPRIDALERANEAATQELEPLGQARVAIAELEARLRALEGGS